MTVWYFDNEDCSGIFSSKEKALDSLHAGAERCEWQILEINDYEDYVCIDYAYYIGGKGWQIGHCDIVSYTLDEDYFA